jgi:hypothetical protein
MVIEMARGSFPLPLSKEHTGEAIASTVHQTAPAQTIPSDILLTQAVGELLPPPPPAVNLVKERSPSASFTPRELDFQAPAAIPASTNSNYLVYVNGASLVTLQQVQQLEPKAFVRQYNGNSVIQAGVFSKGSNAQELAKKLQSQGIDVRLVSLATGEETDFGASKSYFVVIPASRQDLPLVAGKVRQMRIDMPVNISQKDQPRGSHVKVGPFPERSQAERLNRYIVDSGLRNARVYYGR